MQHRVQGRSQPSSSLRYCHMTGMISVDFHCKLMLICEVKPWCSRGCCETKPIRERTSTDEHVSLHELSHPSSTGLVDRIKQLILVSMGMSFKNSRIPS